MTICTVNFNLKEWFTSFIIYKTICDLYTICTLQKTDEGVQILLYYFVFFRMNYSKQNPPPPLYTTIFEIPPQSVLNWKDVQYIDLSC